MNALRRSAVLIAPAAIAWCLAVTGIVVRDSWLAVRFRDPWFPTTPAVDLPPGEAAPDVVARVSDAATVVLAAAVLVLIVELSKAAWLSYVASGAPIKRRLVLTGNLMLLAFQILLVHDSIRYWSYYWWSWLTWQLGLGSLPAEVLREARLVAFGSSGMALLVFASLAVMAVAREPTAREDRAP